MTESQDWKDFCDLIHAADEVTAGKPRSAMALGIMFSALEPYTRASVAEAVKEHVRTNKFAVTLSDIIRHIEGDSADRAIVAWTTFLRALDRYGYYDSVRFPDPAYHYAAQQLGGWERIGHEWGQLSDKELQFRRAEWCKLYEIGLRVASWDGDPGKIAVPKYLRGFYERNNREGGYLDYIPDVVEIATGEKIKLASLDGPRVNVFLPGGIKLNLRRVV